MSRVTALAAAALATAIAWPALADDHRLDAAWDAAIAEETETVLPAVQATLNLVAYHAAVARLCDGFAVDEAKITAASNTAVNDILTGLEGDELAARHAALLIDIGTRHGLFLAEGSLQPETFCQQAAEVRDDETFEDFWR